MNTGERLFTIAGDIRMEALKKNLSSLSSAFYVVTVDLIY